jgi:hypothetical protein
MEMLMGDRRDQVFARLGDNETGIALRARALAIPALMSSATGNKHKEFVN